MGKTDGAYKIALDLYGDLGIDVESALSKLKGLELSIHCWQGDDVGGFESPDSELSGGGIQVTGNYPGKARNPGELRMDIEKLLSLLPGSHRLNLHASYGEFGGKSVERDEITAEYFQGWIDWAKKGRVKLDFNSTYFSHPKAEDGYTLASTDDNIRDFWIEHAKRCRSIARAMGQAQGSTCLHNVWIPDGEKDYTVDRYGRRSILTESLDEIFAEEMPSEEIKDAVEAKLFGIGSEAFVVGSHEYYLAYAISRKKLLCIDMGHFHPSELVADKISSILHFVPELLLHISRPMRWDSDHVVLLNDDLRLLCEELVRSGRIQDVYLGLDFFDASINRLGAWAVGSRSTLKGLLAALLQPAETLKEFERGGKKFARMALLEELKTLPLGAVWDHYCEAEGIATDRELIEVVHNYERDVQSAR